MTYCLAINLNQGMAFCSDSRTNAGMDNVSTYSKMHTFVWRGERTFVLLSAGNLATTQAVVKKMRRDVEQGMVPNLVTVTSMHEAADYVCMVSTDLQHLHASRDLANTSFEASFIFGGQIGFAAPEMFMIYPQGNYIHESDEHPSLQIGETKYGKPILDRVIKRHVSLERAARCALVSMNSTVRSNVTVGPPIELLIYERDSLNAGRRLYLTEDDPFAREISERGNAGLIPPLASLAEQILCRAAPTGRRYRRASEQGFRRGAGIRSGGGLAQGSGGGTEIGAEIRPLLVEHLLGHRFAAGLCLARLEIDAHAADVQLRPAGAALCRPRQRQGLVAEGGSTFPTVEGVFLHRISRGACVIMGESCLQCTHGRRQRAARPAGTGGVGDGW